MDRHLFPIPLNVYQLVNRLDIRKPSRGPVLEPAKDAESFTICHVGADGATDFRYSPDDNVAICVIRSINICRSMLKNEDVQKAFRAFAEEVGKNWTETYTDPWKSRISDATNDFLEKILTEFSVVFVEHGWENRRSMAAAFRCDLEGKFESRNLCILVNGATVYDMVNAANKENRATKDTERKAWLKNYEDFLFLEINCLLHEIGHLFITYLGLGKQQTPLSMSAETGYKDDPKVGEAGRRLEALILGGTMGYWVDADHGTEDDECGAPYLFREKKQWKIKWETIERTLKCEFKFPYECEEEAEIRKLEPLDRYMEMDDMEYPMVHAAWVPHMKALKMYKG